MKNDDKTSMTTYFRALSERLKKDLGTTTKTATKKKYLSESLLGL